VDADRPTAGIEALHRLLLAELETLPDDALARADLLGYVVALSVELRVRSELAIGRLLLACPDAGGRSSPCGKLPASRGAREILGIDRTCASWLRRLGELDDATIESVIDEVWSGGWPLPLTAGSVVRGLAESKPPTSRGVVG
jgi:hypothetical protein